MIRKYFLALLLVLYFTGTLNADVFVKNSSNVGVSVGAASSYGQNYLLVGISASYFFINNLSVDVYYRGWFNATPTQHELSIGSNYYVTTSKKIRPYFGLFTRQTIVTGYSSYSSIGARGGIALINTKNTYTSFGYAIEKYINCPGKLECSNSYPEIVFGISF
ncbi:hypothetical protein [Sulfurimonas sp.]